MIEAIIIIVFGPAALYMIWLAVTFTVVIPLAHLARLIDKAIGPQLAAVGARWEARKARINAGIDQRSTLHNIIRYTVMIIAFLAVYWIVPILIFIGPAEMFGV